MLALRSSLLFSTLILAFFIAVTQSLELGGSIEVKYLGNPNQKRAPVKKDHDPPPCAPDGVKPKIIKVTDDGAKVGVLPYTFEMVRDANAKHAAGKTTKSKSKLRSLLDVPLEKLKQWNARDLAKRQNGVLRQWYNQATAKVATDSGDAHIWSASGDIEDQMIATGDLSGCTVLIVSSPFVTIMIHVWERRANEGAAWLLDHFGAAQKTQDLAFAKKGQELLAVPLRAFGGTIANGFGGWLPLEQTTVNIVAPGINPDYTQTKTPATAVNPFYAVNDPNNPGGLIFPNGAITLQQMSVVLVIPGRESTQSKIHTYRRRYSNDPKHRTDDREFIIVKPVIMPNKEVWAMMHYDDNKTYPLSKLSVAPSS
ncbi:uncharacterized protein BP5553_02489 [Venustampulla echinocandica]|uniref:Uncharacterized protein n=1 Tax=Venustampulla echinocandica TaxID=2656787 RepID=A0A370U403_9HELO|nr:uncharacterized protein BP5553_02489 [Venustampulla echinocandica]RDL42510.1 hypothetical protein BP5553_02489 [Venustampulla echinocandica]